ncbi:MAG: S8 family serine peptidase, partial [Akkermansiaceae bacterium]|nr:S8 family serine peptidase [Akkermansiaceae bacterium]
MPRRSLPPVLFALLALVACFGDDDAVAPEFEPAASPDLALEEHAPVYIVMFHDGVDAVQAARDLSAALGTRPRSVWAAVRGFSAVIPESRLAAVRSDPRVAVVSQNWTVSLPDPVREVRPAAPRWCIDEPSHPACNGDTGDPGSGGQIIPWGITRVGGPGTTASGRAWVIDTGVDPDHPDLKVDPDCSANFVKRGNLTIADWEDGNGHGTHVAGTIAAIDNDRDVVGVAP